MNLDMCSFLCAITFVIFYGYNNKVITYTNKDLSFSNKENAIKLVLHLFSLFFIYVALLFSL